MIRLTEMQLARLVRSIPPALAAVGIIGALWLPGELFGWVSIAAVAVGAYAHGRLVEKVRAAAGTRLEEGPPVSIPREAAAWLSGCEHVSLPVSDNRERAEVLRELLSGEDLSVSWCPICHAVYAPPKLLEHHRDNCPRERALKTIRHAMGKETL